MLPAALFLFVKIQHSPTVILPVTSHLKNNLSKPPSVPLASAIPVKAKVLPPTCIFVLDCPTVGTLLVCTGN